MVTFSLNGIWLVGQDRASCKVPVYVIVHTSKNPQLNVIGSGTVQNWYHVDRCYILQSTQQQIWRLTELKFYIIPNTKYVISETFFRANLLA